MKRFESYAKGLTWSAAFVLTAFLAGCGGGDDGGGGFVGGNNAAPTVLSTAPADAAASVCVNQAANATFSKAMDPASVNDTSFTVADSTGAAVPGTVAMDSTKKIATFTPAADLQPSTAYTATINGGANGVKDSGGKTLAANKVWTFTTDDGTCRVQAPVALGNASTFGAASGVGITNTGTLTKITGDAGVPAASTSVTGLHDMTPPPGVVFTEVPGTNVGEVSGTIFTTDSPAADAGQTVQAMASDVSAAFDDLAARPGGTDPSNGTGELGGLTLGPGVYLANTFQVTGGDLTLDAQGDPNAIWVFQCDTDGPTIGDTAARSVTLKNGAQAKNVYWASNGAATINSVGGGTMVGTIITRNGASIGSGTSTGTTNVKGRVFVLNNPITMNNAVITVPAP
ncbi:MAG TPA: ice-binding family protein [Burkholderiales bacterium]|nr:ice-binding family protein [Burkholderiales bacterium]